MKASRRPTERQTPRTLEDEPLDSSGNLSRPFEERFRHAREGVGHRHGDRDDGELLFVLDASGVHPSAAHDLIG